MSDFPTEAQARYTEEAKALVVNASRRSFLKMMVAGAAGAGLGLASQHATAQIPGERPHQAEGIKVLNP
jgi:hypothetical protein